MPTNFVTVTSYAAKKLPTVLSPISLLPYSENILLNVIPRSLEENGYWTMCSLCGDSLTLTDIKAAIRLRSPSAERIIWSLPLFDVVSLLKIGYRSKVSGVDAGHFLSQPLLFTEARHFFVDGHRTFGQKRPQE